MEIEIQIQHKKSKAKTNAILIVESEKDIFNPSKQKVRVLSGSTFVEHPTTKKGTEEGVKILKRQILEKRKPLLEKGVINNNTFLKDYEFETLNGASEFFLGRRGRGGPEEFGILENGKWIPLDEKYNNFRVKKDNQDNNEEEIQILSKKITNNTLTIDQLAQIYKEEYENKVNENKDRKSDEYKSSTYARWFFAYDYANEIMSLSKEKSREDIKNICNKILEPTLGAQKSANMEIAAIIKLFNPKNQQQKSDNVFAKNYPIETPLVPACNVIYTGIPGCGKSYRIDNFDFVGEEKYNKWKEDNSEAINGIKKNKDGKTIVYHTDRVLFYPDYSYSDFVGQIIPKKVGEKIDYPFVPGPFTNALEYAFKHPEKNCALIIEEINRGNAAAIFGDVFQLLDRKEDGESEYKITNENVYTYLTQNSNIDKNLFDGEKIYLPKNLSLVATMNTTDQNLYVLDSAFTRRWKKVLVANDFSKNKKLLPLEKFYITWGKFAEKTNEILREKLKGFGNEDKQLGAYFVHSCLIEDKANYDADLKDEFANKVIQYLWSDVLKHNNRNIVFNPETKTLEQAIDCFKQEDINKLFVEDLANVFEQTTQKETPNEQ